MENLFDTSKSIHDKIVKTMIKPLARVEIKKIIDAGSGKTSASVLLKYFQNAQVDAIIFLATIERKTQLKAILVLKELRLLKLIFAHLVLERNMIYV